MKKTPEQNRILGRRLARELSREELENASAGASTWTMTYPPDGPYKDSGGGGSVDV
jgi:hypothetical protein